MAALTQLLIYPLVSRFKTMQDIFGWILNTAIILFRSSDPATAFLFGSDNDDHNLAFRVRCFDFSRKLSSLQKQRMINLSIGLKLVVVRDSY